MCARHAGRRRGRARAGVRERKEGRGRGPGETRRRGRLCARCEKLRDPRGDKYQQVFQVMLVVCELRGRWIRLTGCSCASLCTWETKQFFESYFMDFLKSKVIFSSLVEQSLSFTSPLSLHSTSFSPLCLPVPPPSPFVSP